MKSTTHHPKGRVALLRLLVLALIGTSLYAIQTLNTTGQLIDATSEAASRQPAVAATVTIADTKLVIPTYELFGEDRLWAITSRERPLSDEKGYELIDIPVTHGDAELPMRVAATLSNDLQSLVNTAEAEGESLMVSSAHRTFAEQRATHDAFVAKNGRSLVDTYVMPVGASEHHTGLAIDFSSVSDECAVDSNSCSLSQSGAVWLAKNASEYGFIQRYPAGKQSITGVGYEPWHYRYVGKPLAKVVYASNLTLEEIVEQIAPGYAMKRN